MHPARWSWGQAIHIKRQGAIVQGHEKMGASPYPQTLTPTERAVCDKVADGLTNRDISEALFVTIKAVEFHIHNSFLKLGVHNRTQLAIAYLSMRSAKDDVTAAD